MTPKTKRTLRVVTIVGLPLLIGLNIAIFLFLQRAVENTVLVPSDQNFKFCPELKQVGFSIKEQTYEGQNLRYYEKTLDEAKATLIFYHGSGRSACENREIMGNFEGLPLNIILQNTQAMGGPKRQNPQKNQSSKLIALARHIKRVLQTKSYLWCPRDGCHLCMSKIPLVPYFEEPTTSIFETAKLYKAYLPSH